MSETPIEADRRRRDRLGFLSGLFMALGASLGFASARAGILGGLEAVDLIFARFIVAAALMLPLLIRFGVRDLAGIGWRRSLVLTVVGGAPFAMLQTGGYSFAPLAHGAVIAPFLRERLSRNHLFGAVIVLTGVLLIGWDGLHADSGPRAWLGDLLFFASSVLWACFTLLLRHWRVPALRATAVVVVLSCLISTPTYFLWVGMAHVQALPFAMIAFQGLVQGGLQGAFTMVAYGQAVVLLGVSRAVLFPAIVPALSVLLGIPIVGEIPGLLQIAGLCLVTLGLLTTIGALQYFWRKRTVVSRSDGGAS